MNIEAELIRLFNLNSTNEISREMEVVGQGGYLSFRRSVTIMRADSPPLYLFVKLSDATRLELDQLQQVSTHFCRTEVVFYGLMAPVLERVMNQYNIEPVFPKSFGQKISDKGTILVMEDMTKQGFRLIDRKSFGIEQAYSVVRTLARLQAAFWIARTNFNNSLNSVLFGSDTFFTNTVKKSGMDFRPMILRNSEYFSANLSKRVKTPLDEEVISAILKEFVDKMTRDTASALPSCADRPIGIVHGDLWLSNFMFKSSETGLICRLFDWQFWDIGLFGFDLGLMMVSSLPTEAMLEHADRIPKEFYRTFKEIFEAKSGSPVPFSEEAALDNMKFSYFWALFWVVTSSSVLWETDYLDVPAMLYNLAFVIRTNRITMPSD